MHLRDGEVEVRVTVPKECTCRVTARTNLPIGPQQVCNILTDPGNARVFRNVKAVTSHNVISNDGKEKVIDMEQLGRWKFLCFGGTFSTSLRITQNFESNTVSYVLLKGGFLRNFIGRWEMQELNQGIGGEKPITTVLDPWAESLPRITCVDLTQEMSLACSPPHSIRHLIGRITAHTTQNVLKDLYTEALRLHEGRPVKEEVVVNRPPLWKTRAKRRRRTFARRDTASV